MTAKLNNIAHGASKRLTTCWAVHMCDRRTDGRTELTRSIRRNITCEQYSRNTEYV